MILKEIADLLQTAGVGTVGTDIFVGDIPHEKNGICIVSEASDVPELDYKLYYLNIGVWVRNKDSQAAYNMLLAVEDALHLKNNYDLTGYHIYFSHSTGTIIDGDRDVQQRKLWKESYKFIYRAIAPVS